MHRVIATYLAIFAGSLAFGVAAAPEGGTYVHKSTGHMVDLRFIAPEASAIHMAETTIVGRVTYQPGKPSAGKGERPVSPSRQLVCHSRQLQAVPNGRAVYGTVQVCE